MSSFLTKLHKYAQQTTIKLGKGVLKFQEKSLRHCTFFSNAAALYSKFFLTLANADSKKNAPGENYQDFLKEEEGIFRSLFYNNQMKLRVFSNIFQNLLPPPLQLALATKE